MKGFSALALRAFLAVGLVAGALALAPAAAPPTPAELADVHDLVFLGEARPVLVRLHVRIDDRPLEAAFDGFMKELFAYLDVNGDGVLDKEEAERAPSLEQIQSGALAQNIVRRGTLTMAELDADKDGKVTLGELSAHYRKQGFRPFQFQVDPGPINIPGAAAFFGGQQPEPTVEAVSAAIFSLLDTNRDGKLSRKELAAAPAVLLALDENEDETVTPRELVPNYKPKGGGMFGRMMAGLGKKGASTAARRTVVPLTAPGEAPSELIRSMQARYGRTPARIEDRKLGRKDLGLDAETFAQLDLDRDGVLDARELAGFVKRPADVELTIRLGGDEPRLELAGKGRRSPVAGQLQVRDGLALLDLGVTRLELRGRADEGGYDSLGGIVRQQYIAQFKSADKDNNGYLDQKEAGASPLYRNLFKAMDRDGDGKLYEKEVIAYLDHITRLQERATACCATLVLSDQSRGLFDLLDVNRDGRLSVREMRGAVGLLKRLDRSGKGHLTRADVPRSYQLALRRGPKLADDPGGARAFLALYRVNYRDDSASRGARGPLWFRKLDRNRDGDVSRKEWIFSEERFKEIDTDGDGLISVAEAEAYDARQRRQK